MKVGQLKEMLPLFLKKRVVVATEQNMYVTDIDIKLSSDGKSIELFYAPGVTFNADVLNLMLFLISSEMPIIFTSKNYNKIYEIDTLADLPVRVFSDSVDQCAVLLCGEYAHMGLDRILRHAWNHYKAHSEEGEFLEAIKECVKPDLILENNVRCWNVDHLTEKIQIQAYDFIRVILKNCPLEFGIISFGDIQYLRIDGE